MARYPKAQQQLIEQVFSAPTHRTSKRKSTRKADKPRREARDR